MTIFGVILFAALIGAVSALIAVIAAGQRSQRLEQRVFALEARRGLATYDARDAVRE